MQPGAVRPIRAALGVALLLALTPTAALAHANLVRSEPAGNASVDQAPGQVQLWFSERPELKLSQVQVFDSQRREVEAGPLQATADPLSLIQKIQPNLPQGVYTVSWHTTSAVDGHVTGGAFAFGLGVTPSATDLAAAAQATQQPPPSPLSIIIRWLAYLGAIGLLGLALFGLMMPQLAGTSSVRAQDWLRQLSRRLSTASQLLAGTLFGATIAAILDQAALSGGGLSGSSLQATLGTALGQMLVARLALAAVVLALALSLPAAVRPSRLSEHRSLGAAAVRELQAGSGSLELARAGVLTALLAYLLLFALSSHALAVTDAPELALMNDWLHLTVAGVWIGGLLALALAVVPSLGSRTRPAADVQPEDFDRNQLFGPIVAGFSRVALISAIGLLITGFYQALVHVGSVDNALSTAYGKTLIVKTGLFAAALLLAGFHRWFLVPATAQPARVAATRARRFFSRTLPLEALLAVGILAATGVLTSLAPANDQGSATAQTRTLGDTRVVFDVVPLTVGPNLFQITLTSKGQPLDDADKVELQLTMLDMEMGQSVVDLDAKGNGVYSAQGDLLSMSGHWRIDLLVRLPGQLDQRTSFNLTVKP